MGKSTYGWFMGFQLHLVINDQGQMVAARVTTGNRDDRKALATMVSELTGTIYADKGYISAQLGRERYAQGLRLITQIRQHEKYSDRLGG